MFSYEQLQELALDVEENNLWSLYSSTVEYEGRVYFELLFEIYSKREEDFSMRREGNIPSREGTLIILKAIKAFKDWKEKLPKGITLYASPYKGDDYGEKRKQLYEKLGFINGKIIT